MPNKQMCLYVCMYALIIVWNISNWFECMCTLYIYLTPPTQIDYIERLCSTIPIYQLNNKHISQSIYYRRKEAQ